MDKTMSLANIEVKELNDESRTITAIGSKEIVDRDGDIVKLDQMDLKKYKSNPTVLWSHSYYELPLAKAIGKKVWVDGNELKFKIQFATEEENPRAEYVYKLFKGGFLKSFSIGFIPDYSDIEYKEDKKTGKQTRIINKSELLEVSVVNVPSNTAALLQTFEKSWKAGDIDGEELLELQNMVEQCKNSAECNINKEDIINIIKNKVIQKEELKELVKELMKEVENEDVDTEEEDIESIYEELFNEFNTDKDDLNELLEDYLDE